MAREVGVLSMSTIPTGIPIGCPSFISDVKKKVTATGNSTMQNKYT
jgi:hypothetical protein